MDLIYLLKALLRRKWLIMICTLLAIVGAFVLTLNQEKLYKSVAQIATGFTSNDQVKLKDESFNIYEIDSKFGNVIEALKSPRVLGMTGYNMLLHDLQNPGKEFRQLTPEDLKSEVYRNTDKEKAIRILTQKYNEEKLLSSYVPEERQIIELLKLYKYDLETFRYVLYANRVARTDYIDIQYRSTSPEMSAYFVNQIVAEFLRNYESSRNVQTAQNIETLQKLVDQKKAELDEKIGNIKTMGTMDVSVESSSKLEQVSNFETRLADERNLLNTANLSMQQVQNRLAEIDQSNSAAAASGNSANTELANLRKQMNDAYNDYQAKGGNNTELYNKYMAKKTEYKNKLMAMASVSSGPAGGVTKADLLQKKSDLELQIKSSQQNISAYEDKVRQLNSSIGAAASRNANNLALQKEVELAQSEYEAVKTRYDGALNSRIAPMDNFRQVLFGQPAVEPEPSKRLIILALSGMSMFVFCCISIIFMEYIDLSIKTPTQFQKVTDLRLMGVVNRVNMKRMTFENIFTDEELPAQSSVFRELLRKLRYEVGNSGKKVFLFTSPRPGEGKSTIIKALAHSLSLSHKKVLIIDTNFPHNTLTQEFEAKPLLEDFVLGDGQDFKKKLDELISPTGIENVDVIGCKGGQYTPAEVLRPGNLLDHMDALRGYYDFIFLEGAQLNERSDSKELLKYADTIVAVVSARSSIKQTDKETIEYLSSLNGNFTGVVLNQVEQQNIDI
ncbi:Wzz/FepE/Etk N-terminal domain-containing protein [Chitinophaga pollutisoli]|uniref:Wzz/FepE/Etk N-terminal domain-containing protein n=1 Tax=Chitinophaga pollutisoli TaxID=3133966 RepID=A0ABZ2YPM9_9BACT